MYSQQREVFSREDHEVCRQKQWASLGAWFLGPKAENGEVFRELLTKAVDSHIRFRHRYSVQSIMAGGQDAFPPTKSGYNKSYFIFIYFYF